MKSYAKLGLNNQLRPVKALSGAERPWTSDFQQDAQMEKGPYANPNEIQKGTTTVTAGGIFSLKDTSGSTGFTYSPATGVISINRNISQSGDINQTGTTNALAVYVDGLLVVGGTERLRESLYTLADAGESNGGAASYYTNSTDWVNVNQSEVSLNALKYPGCDLYLECLYRAGTTGEAARTFTARFLNATDNQAVPNGTVSGTVQSSGANTPGEFPRVRGDTAMIIGTVDKDYVIQYKSSGGGLYVDLFQGRLVTRY